MTDPVAAQRRFGIESAAPESGVAEAREHHGAAAKVLRVLETFSVCGGGISLAELTGRTGLAKSTAHRMLAVLRDAEFVESVDGHYHLSSKVSMLSAGRPTALSPGARARLMPFLAELYELTHEAVQLGVRSGSTVHVVERIHSHRAAELALRRGDRQPLHRTAAGKVLAAGTSWTGLGAQGRLVEEFARVRASGVAFERGDLHPGVCGVAAALRGPRQEPVAAIAVLGPVSRFRPETVVPHVRRIAQQASRQLYSARCPAAEGAAS